MDNLPMLPMDTHCHNKIERASFKVRIINFFKWCLAFTGLVVTTSVCPFCGQPGCPVGVGAATTIGALFALFMQNWKEPFKRLCSCLNKKGGVMFW